MSEPLVSAIVPSYNHERFVTAALRSLADQTYPSLELIISDDGSSDGTVAQVQELLPTLTGRFQRIEFVANGHRGIGQNVRTCLECSRSDLVYMLDSDDVAAPRAIECLLPLMESPEVALAVGDNSSIGPDGSEYLPSRGWGGFSSFLAYHTANREFSPERDFGTYRSLIAGNYVPNGWLLRKSAVDAVGGYGTGFLIEDWELLLRLVKRYRIAFTPEVLLRYRLHDHNTVRLQRRRMFLDTARILIRERRYSLDHDAVDAWETHARLVLPGLTPTDIQSGSFLEDLFPTLSSGDLDSVRTLASALQRMPGPAPAEEVAQALPGVLPKGSAGERIHLVATCWNDARMLPFFFRHYDPLVERYIIYDDGSTDDSLQLLAAHPRVEVRRFEWTHPESFVLSELNHYNRAWKECRGLADWVFAVDLDEHLYAPDLGRLLKSYRAQGISVVPTLGFEMVTDGFPPLDETLANTLRLGAPSPSMSKLAAFSPSEIEELNHQVGGHSSLPTGRVIAPASDCVRLLHFKYLGYNYVHDRDQALRSRLKAFDHSQGWGHQWNESPNDVTATLDRYRAQAVDVFATHSSVGSQSAWPDLPRLENREYLLGLEKARASLEQELSRITQEADSQRSALRQLADDAARAADRFRLEMAAAADNMTRERERWAESSDRLALALEATSSRVSALESSRTWRWTRPARDLASLISWLLQRPPDR